MRLLFWVAVVVIVLLWLQHQKKARMAPKPPPRPAAGDASGETMVRCAQCGVHIPVSEAVSDSAGIAFCSEEHRARHRA